jgi:hypothetical protein
VRLGPSVPEGAPAASTALVAVPLNPPPAVIPSAIPLNPSAAASPSHATDPPAAVASATAGSDAPAPQVIAKPARRVTVSHGSILSCKSADGDVLRAADCGSLPALDAAVMPRLRTLANCEGAPDSPGKLRLIVRADFDRGISVDLDRGRSLPAPEPLFACARAALSTTNIRAMTHTEARYSIAYTVVFSPPDQSAGAPPTTAIESVNLPPQAETAPDHALPQAAPVEWDVAIVRDAPKTGKIIARLPRGTTLHLGPEKDGWYPVKYGESFSSDGWVYRGAIGR